MLTTVTFGYAQVVMLHFFLCVYSFDEMTLNFVY